MRTRNEKRSMGLPARVGNGAVPLAITVVTYAKATIAKGAIWCRTRVRAPSPTFAAEGAALDATVAPKCPRFAYSEPASRQTPKTAAAMSKVRATRMNVEGRGMPGL